MKVTKTRSECPKNKVVSLWLQPEDGSPAPEFYPGQYITICDNPVPGEQFCRNSTGVLYRNGIREYEVIVVRVRLVIQVGWNNIDSDIMGFVCHNRIPLTER